jgi:hypothetical protein
MSRVSNPQRDVDLASAGKLSAAQRRSQQPFGLEGKGQRVANLEESTPAGSNTTTSLLRRRCRLHRGRSGCGRTGDAGKLVVPQLASRRRDGWDWAGGVERRRCYVYVRAPKSEPPQVPLLVVKSKLGSQGGKIQVGCGSWLAGCGGNLEVRDGIQALPQTMAVGKCHSPLCQVPQALVSGQPGSQARGQKYRPRHEDTVDIPISSK